MKLFDHPCKHTCSGWQQGHEEGLRAGKLWAVETLKGLDAMKLDLLEADRRYVHVALAKLLESKIDEVMK